MKRFTLLLVLLISTLFLASCDYQPDSDQIQHQQQEQLQAQSNAAVGMPSVVNFREKRLLKQIFEMRDTDILTYTYVQSEMTGKFIFLGQSIGFGIPYSTEYTNPQRRDRRDSREDLVLPQADPNGLFSPGAAEGTWVMLVDPKTGKASPVYVEPRITVTTFPLPDSVLQK